MSAQPVRLVSQVGLNPLQLLDLPHIRLTDLGEVLLEGRDTLLRPLRVCTDRFLAPEGFFERLQVRGRIRPEGDTLLGEQRLDLANERLGRSGQLSQALDLLIDGFGFEGHPQILVAFGPRLLIQTKAVVSMVEMPRRTGIFCDPELRSQSV